MNMIVCTCDTCGKVVDSWSGLNINLAELNEHREVCSECKKRIQKQIETFLDEITVINKDNE